MKAAFRITVLLLATGLPALPASGDIIEDAPGAAKHVSPTPPASIRLTLAEATARGLETSHRLAELEARGEAARAVTAGRQAADRPQVSVIGGYTRTNHVEEFRILMPNASPRLLYPDVPDNYRARLDLQWPIYTGGRADALARAAGAEARAVDADLSSARADLRLEIARAFWAYLTARESVRVLEQSLARLATHVADVKSRLDVGLLSPGDVLAVEAQHARQRVLLIEARNTSEVAAADLKRLTGLDSGIEIVLEASLENLPSSTADAAALVGDARGHRPERQALERRAEAATARTASASAGKLPVVALAGGVDYARPNPRIFPRADEWRESWDAGLNVSWSLWDGGRVRADLAEAVASGRAARERLEEFDSVLEVEVRQRRSDLESSLAALPAAADAVRSAAEARRVMAERFAAGVATSTDVLDAQLVLLQSELDRTRAFANARLAEARLARAIGQ